jgi:hypothetical protein
MHLFFFRIEDDLYESGDASPDLYCCGEFPEMFRAINHHPMDKTSQPSGLEWCRTSKKSEHAFHDALARQTHRAYYENKQYDNSIWALG